MKKLIKSIRNNPGAAIVVANTGLVCTFFLLVGVYREAKEEGLLDLTDFLKTVVKPF